MFASRFPGRWSGVELARVFEQAFGSVESATVVGEGDSADGRSAVDGDDDDADTSKNGKRACGFVLFQTIEAQQAALEAAVLKRRHGDSADDPG